MITFVSKAALCAIALCLLVACQYKFDKTRWNTKEDINYPYRKLMLDDLIHNHRIKGLTYQQLVGFIGEPRLDTVDHKGYYDIITDYGWDIDPVYTKDLVVEFNKDLIVTGFKVKEWKKE